MPAEIPPLADRFPDIEFLPASGADAGGGRALPLISELIRAGTSYASGDVYGLVNSDIRFTGGRSELEQLFLAAHGGAAFAHRDEVAAPGICSGLPYLYGYDFMLIDRRFIASEDLEGFTIGAPWWDYLTLYLLATRRVPLKVITSPVITHLTHAQVWSEDTARRARALVARRLRHLAEDEGPVAGLLAYLCTSLEEDVLPSYGMDTVGHAFGTLLGTAMVNLIRERCTDALWFDPALQSGPPHAATLHSAPNLDARRVLTSISDAGGLSCLEG
jgi:hypothetical protein